MNELITLRLVMYWLQIVISTELLSLNIDTLSLESCYSRILDSLHFEENFGGEAANAWGKCTGGSAA